MQFLQLPARADIGATIAWINPDAAAILASSGVEPGNSTSLSSFMLEAYAFTAADAGEGRLLIDYYGSSGTTLYGGSGRAGIINSMQVKGVGRTPLTPTEAHWHHGHGRMLLEEALREAVYSELAHSEFPLGAVRTLAVIECSEEITDPAGNRHRTALLVRPFVVRACHLERAFGFRAEESGYRRQFHRHDVSRVSAWIAQLEFNSQPRLDAYADSMGKQIGHAHVAHWFHGGWYSSVMALDGRLIDFGSARRVKDWRYKPHETYGPCFGDELRFAEATVRSLADHIKHYASTTLDVEQALQALMGAYRQHVAEQISRQVHKAGKLDSCTTSRFYDLFTASFQSAQRAEDHKRAVAAEIRLAEEMTSFPSDLHDARESVLNRVSYGHSQSRERVQEHLTHLIEQCSGGRKPSSFQRGVDELICQLRGAIANGAL